MNPPSANEEALLAENEELRARLEDAEETLRAIRAGEVDALIVEGSSGPQVFILQSSDTESNRFRSDILGKVSDAVIAIDEERRVIYINAAAERQYDVTASQVLGHPITEVYESRWSRPADEEAVTEALAETGQWRGRYLHVRRDGKILNIEASVSCLFTQDGKPSGRLGVIRDITARMAAEEALRENQARLQLTLESAHIGDWELDLKNDKTTRSLLHDRIFGYREPVVQWGFKQFLHHVHRDDRSEVERQFREAVEQVKDWQFECRIIWPNGIIRWINVHGSICRDARGEPGRMLGVVFDITERKQAEEALRENGALFATIIDQAPGGVYVVDERFRMMQVNSLAQPTFAAAEPVMGRDLAEIMRILWGPEVGKQLIDIFWHTLETGESYVSPRFSGHRHDIDEERSYDWETRRITLPNGRHGVVCYFSDITEQRKLEDALRASEQRATDIVQSISDGFVTFDLDWRITYLSARGAEMLSPLDKTVINVIGKNHWDEFPHALGGPIEENYRRAMRDQTPVQFEVFYTPLDAWFEIRAYPSSSGLSVYFLDISERKEAEKALAEQAAALVMADRSKDEFLAMLAHELRNPLAPMRNATEILRSPAAGSNDRVVAQDMMARQIENMSRMIDDLLDVSRITEGKIELHRKPVDLQAVLSAAAEVVRPSCAANRQTLTISLPDAPVFMNGDGTRLEQVFGNLLTNACKYSGTGSEISLIAETFSEEEVVVRIMDNGIGIDPELLPRVFDLFVQSSRTLDRSHGGLGIGLTIVSRLVKLHGGTIEARSLGLGHGAEFIVRLPLQPAPSVSIPNSASSGPARSLRMLIVDDNKDAAETMAMLQELRGHETRVAHDGPEAISVADEFLPQVILLDIGLPGMDGFEVARRIRTMPSMATAFLVALTGYGTDEDRELAKAAGFDEHLAKPADLELLREWLATRVL
ncbi:MAG: PAS domain S-box protein [Verrucomicrobiota bacterium]